MLMHKQINKVIASVNKEITLTPREVLFAISAGASCCAACAMTGMVIGMLLSPRKHTTIGSHNGCNNDCRSTKTEAAPAEENEE